MPLKIAHEKSKSEFEIQAEAFRLLDDKQRMDAQGKSRSADYEIPACHWTPVSAPE